MRSYHVDPKDKKSLTEVWHVPHIFTKERGLCLKCSGAPRGLPSALTCNMVG